MLLKWLNSAEPGLFGQVEATLVKTAYEFCHGNQVQTARLLGLSRNVLRTLLKRHGLLETSRDLAEESARVMPVTPACWAGAV